MPEASPMLPSGDPAPQQQVYETESSQEYFKKEEDGKVVEEVRETRQRQKPVNPWVKWLLYAPPALTLKDSAFRQECAFLGFLQFSDENRNIPINAMN
jgi:hypothetical protein